MADRLQRKASASSRASLGRQRSARSTHDDIFSDENAIDDFTVADGYTPAAVASETNASARSQAQSPPRLANPRTNTPRASEEPGSDIQKRRSIYQMGAQISASRNSLLARHDEMSGARPEMSQRPSSMISTFSIPRAQSPYVGASGPSHPYAMYPQDASLNRTSTVSSFRPADRPYSGPSHPNHPYAMYSQSTVPDMATDPLAASRDIATLGFPGFAGVYARRNRPDGEEADDLIAMDGYTEQLPPYTRYPDNATSKERYAPGGPESLSSPESSTRLDSSSSPEEGLLNSSRNEEVAEEGERNGEAGDGADNDPSTRLAASKAKWARKGKRRFFRGKIPAWVICLGLLVIVIIAATLGGVIGRYLPHNYHPPHGPPNNEGAPFNFTNPNPQTAMLTVTTTTLLDAAPLTATPSNLPPLPTGDFGFFLPPASQASSSCLSGPGQASAWSCTDSGYMFWNVTPSDIDTTHVSMEYSNPSGQLQYGDQPPDMNGSVGLTLMEDLEEPSLGPAFFFQVPFTKQVILPEMILNASNNKRSLSEKMLQAFENPRKLYSRDENVNPGDSPWVCFWNGTLLEGFIYITQSGLSSASPLSDAFTTTVSATASLTPTSTSSQPSPTTAALKPRRRKFHGSEYSDDASGSYAMGAEYDANIQMYPKAMKISERRVPGNPVRPYCVQMNVHDDMSMSPILGDNGSPVEILLDEVEPETQQRVALAGIMKGTIFNKDKRAAGLVERDDESACLCQWLIE